ncbi:DUF6542 domain-containing protein [Streptomyces antimicrobicus]|uniref:DUF6542 domain-containing protein n=1 Tax=Streptomyces antimicrobicus TaxID=2883108 RepID=A0ABS8B965_9ACTN|nr:DUF6542 domain-containing protein [Streptomyces antimicrobicus]MCB5181111.1 hypothetical protein [Streptomyces antimicrobicus]
MERYTTRSDHHPAQRPASGGPAGTVVPGPRPGPRTGPRAGLRTGPRAGSRPRSRAGLRPGPRTGPHARSGRRLPRPKLTGLGGGLFAVVAMVLAAGIDWLVFDSSMVGYGVLFLPAAAATALWVRPADLITAPIAAPIAFAVGAWFIAEGSGGFGARLMGLVTALSLNAGWLYAGTLVAALIVVVRKAVLVGRRRMPQRRLG